MQYFVYIAECKDKSYYTGITWNVKKRIVEHNAGVKTPIQAGRRPVRLVCAEEFNTRIEAARREKEIKGWRREKKQKLIQGFTSLH